MKNGTEGLKRLKKLKSCWPVLAVFLYAAFQLFLLAHHENWRDEAQAWQIAKNLDLPGLFAQLRYEGHPCLWYLILMPFAKLGLPFVSMNFVSVAVMTGAAWLLMKRSPFGWPVRLALVFGGFYVYYYPVISRSYCLIPLLLAWLAVLGDRPEDFAALWACKESMGKESGYGLPYPPSRLAVPLPEDGGPLRQGEVYLLEGRKLRAYAGQGWRGAVCAWEEPPEEIRWLSLP